MGKNGLLILTFTRSLQTGKCRPRVETAAGKRQTRQMSGHNLLRQPTKRLSKAQADALGKRDGSVRVRALTSHQSSSISIPVRSHISVEFVVGSPLVPRVFLWVPWFVSIHKSNIFKSQFGQVRRPVKVDVAFFPSIESEE